MAEFPLTDESERISDRLLVLVTRARLWKMAAVFSLPFADKHPDRSEALQKWREQAAKLRKDLEQLLVQVHQFPIEAPDITRPSYSTSPRPISGRHRWASGTRSPDAPSEPRLYTTGRIPLL